jgi:hypothetical protein
MAGRCPRAEFDCSGVVEQENPTHVDFACSSEGSGRAATLTGRIALDHPKVDNHDLRMPVDDQLLRGGGRGP